MFYFFMVQNENNNEINERELRSDTGSKRITFFRKIKLQI